MEWLATYLEDVLLVIATIPVTVSEKFFLVNLLSFIALAYLSFRLFRREYGKKGRKGFFAFLFPRATYLSQSAKIDYGIFFINILLSPLILVGVGLQTWISIQVGNGLVELNSGEPVFRGDWSTATYALFILGYTLAADLSVYLVHRFHHSSDIFWPLHRLHHSATVLTPVTLFRKHPIWNLTSRLMHLTLTGLFQGLFVFVFYGGPAFEVLFGLNTIYVFYNFLGANLRHSHVWLSWGNALSHIFISPAMHQIHHDPKRMNRNYGEVFAIWDWLFGTLYVPKGFERFEIGLGEAEGDRNRDLHGSIVQAYYEPVRASWQEIMAKFSRSV